MSVRVPTLVLLTVLLGGPALAAGTSEVRGKLSNLAGDPVQDVTVTFRNTTVPDITYSGKSNRRGTYYIPNLLFYEPGKWTVTIDSEDWSPVKVRVESRLADRTLVDQFDGKFPSGSPFTVMIRAFGSAVLDFTLVPTEQEAPPQAPVAVAAPGATDPAAALLKPRGEAAGGAAPSPSPAEDPVMEAARLMLDDKVEEAIPLFEKSIELAPEEADRRERFARALLRLDRYGEALIQGNKAVALGPERPTAHLVVAEIQYGKGASDRAAEALSRVLETAGGDVRILERAAALAAEIDNPGLEIAANETIVAARPDKLDAWLALGDLYNERGESEKARRAFEKVTELDPENAYKTFFNLGALIENKPQLSAADNRKAMEAFKKAIEIRPDYAPAHRHLAYALMRDGNLAHARTELERYLELEPEAADRDDIRATIKALPKK